MNRNTPIPDGAENNKSYSKTVTTATPGDYGELREQLTNALAATAHGFHSSQLAAIWPLIQTHTAAREAAAEYQTYVGKETNAHSKREWWVARIAYEGRQIYGNVLSSEKEAYAAIARELSHIQRAKLTTDKGGQDK